MKKASRFKKLIIVVVVIVVGIGAGITAWSIFHKSGPGAGFASGNGRIEATEVLVAAKLAGRITQINVDEGDFVTEGQILAQMQVTVLDAQHDEAIAQHQQTIAAVASAVAEVADRQSDKAAAIATVVQRESELLAAQQRLDRGAPLVKSGAYSAQNEDDDRASVRNTRAALDAAKAQLTAAQAMIDAANAEVVSAQFTETAAKATIARIDADIVDSQLTSPRAGRVQFRVAQPGEVLAAGGSVLDIVDLNDVYMTFFLSDVATGKVALGSEARLVLDAAPDLVIPAKISFVATVAQFTPKTVETATERQKLMFRIRARIDADVLETNKQLVKTGLPGVAWIKLNPNESWPAELTVKLPK